MGVGGREAGGDFPSSGLEEIKRNDVIVFNFPHYHRWDSIGMDIMAYYVKRCVALPGDTFEIRGGYNKVRGYEGVLGNEDEQYTLSRLLLGDNLQKNAELFPKAQGEFGNFARAF